ncbi:LysR family transcriptional regulator [Litoribrevibacter albus]|uniref:LysR family transcriptional regulator n=1 Tax=Litoribrevibacter albus TaxID=1473156 RepID=A0AA37W6X9_9GAMM|nr:LysR family transcriptional regulator [Litoribrevibacter albus]GLQ29966.1 LysR family transcriptional regulator [Litoribrevibacter albus]
MINPVWLRSFCTLVEVGNFTRTADRLFMTQSGVSQHIRKLEEQLGVLLLLREGKHFTLSDAGERLYREGREVILTLSELEAHVREDSAYEGEVRVMSPGSVGLKLYPRLLELQKQYPKLVIDYRFGPNSDVETSISESRADIGFMSRPSTLADVSCDQIMEEPLLLITPREIKTPTWETLNVLGFIDHPDGAHHAYLLLSENYSEFQYSDQFEKKGFSNQISLILEPVSLGLGFTVLPSYAVEAFHSPHLIRAHHLANPVSEPLYLATRARITLPKRVMTVLEEAKQWLGNSR